MTKERVKEKVDLWLIDPKYPNFYEEKRVKEVDLLLIDPKILTAMKKKV